VWRSGARGSKAACCGEREARRGQKFELRLTSGDPIKVQVRDADPGEAPQDENAEPAEEAEDAEEDTDLDVASATNTLHVLEGVAAEGRNWFRGREWVGAWAGNSEAVLHPFPRTDRGDSSSPGNFAA